MVHDRRLRRSTTLPAIQRKAMRRNVLRTLRVHVGSVLVLAQ
jgi:hypothetical protein